MTTDSAGIPFQGRTLPSAAFAGDDGRADPAVLRALARQVTDFSEEAALVAAIGSARLFVAVVALADEGAHMALLTVTGADGRSALPVFTSPETLQRWRPDARPVPVPGPRAALSAVAEGCDLLDLDPAGPVRYLVRRPAVWCLGRGLAWLPSYADPGVADEIATLAASHGLRARCERGESAELRVVLGVPAGLAEAELAAVVSGFERGVSRSERIAESVDSLELTVHPLEPTERS